jgi:EpsI family protein
MAIGNLLLKWQMAVVPLFLAVQTLAVYGGLSREHPPPIPNLSHFPVGFANWRTLRDEPVEPEIAAVLHADQLLSRTYLRGQTNELANLFVAWFQSQRGGLSQPHSPKVCLPAAGWTPETTGTVTLRTPAGEIPVSQYVVANRSQRALIMYWYQSPRRVTANEWSAKLWLIADAARDHRTDTALVRIVVWINEHRDAEAASTGLGFARDLYPVLRQQLPR